MSAIDRSDSVEGCLLTEGKSIPCSSAVQNCAIICAELVCPYTETVKRVKSGVLGLRKKSLGSNGSRVAPGADYDGHSLVCGLHDVGDQLLHSRADRTRFRNTNNWGRGMG